MARPLRIEFPGALYHVTTRGNGREAIFVSDDDRLAFLSVLSHVAARFRLVVYAYCLMDDRYHLLLETPEANLSKALRQLNGVYTQAFNRRHGRTGHVVQGRFKAVLIDREHYLLELCRDVVLNPVRAKLVRKAGSYRWSSYRATAGRDPVPPFLAADWLLSHFGRQRPAARRRYEEFVAAGTTAPSPWESVQGQVLLGGSDFVERMRPGLHDKRHVKSSARRAGNAQRPALTRMFTRGVLGDRQQRDAAIHQAHIEHGYSLSEIGGAVALHYSTVSRIVGRVDAASVVPANAKSRR